MRTLIVDDEPLACSRLARLCEAQPDLEVVAQAGSGAAAIHAIRAYRPDLILLDVELQDMSGFDVLRSIGMREEHFAIMVTAHPEYALQAFAADAIDYLTKPVDACRFGDAIERARRRLAQACRIHLREEVAAELRAALVEHREPADARLVGEKAQRLYFLEAEAVDYLESDGNYVVIHVGEDRYISRNTLKHLATTLAPLGFVRIERSLLINLRRVAFAERLGQGEFAFTLPSGRQLISGRAHRKAILRELRSLRPEPESRAQNSSTST